MLNVQFEAATSKRWHFTTEYQTASAGTAQQKMKNQLNWLGHRSYKGHTQTLINNSYTTSYYHAW